MTLPTDAQVHEKAQAMLPGIPSMGRMTNALDEERRRIAQVKPDPNENECDRCNGDGYIITENDVRLCECRKVNLPLKRWKYYLASVARSSQEKENEQVRIAQSVDPTTGKVPAILRTWAKFPHCKGVILQGPSGTGKTCAAHYIARRIMKTHGLRGRFVDVRYLSLMVPRMVDQDSAAAYVRDVENWVIDPNLVLVLDDIGGEAARDSVRTRIHDYLNERFLQRAWTIVTTNLSMNELLQQYGEVVIQRCLAGARWMFTINLDGENLRASMSESGRKP